MPVAKSLYLCDGHLDFNSRKTDLMGIFDSIRPQGGYPHIQPSFVVFARLAQGLGTIPFRVWTSGSPPPAGLWPARLCNSWFFPTQKRSSRWW
jgi:hypothetical protein